jgi:hypothetical protein
MLFKVLYQYDLLFISLVFILPGQCILYHIRHHNNDSGTQQPTSPVSNTATIHTPQCQWRSHLNQSTLTHCSKSWRLFLFLNRLALPTMVSRVAPMAATIRGALGGHSRLRCAVVGSQCRRSLGTASSGGDRGDGDNGRAPGPTGPGGRVPTHVSSPGQQVPDVPIDDGSLFFVAETAGLHLKGMSQSSFVSVLIFISTHFQQRQQPGIGK